MSSWKTTCKWVVVISLLFLGIPIRLKAPDEENIKLFDSYILKFNKTYQNDTEEYSKRFEAFKNSLRQVDEYNALRSHSVSARYGLTQFSDLTSAEFQKRQLKSRNPDLVSPMVYTAPTSTMSRVRRQLAAEGFPLQIDWRARSVLAPVRDQGLCGACWAYSTVQAAEAMAAIGTNFTRFSVQQMVDCARNGNLGCMGGDICSLLQWMELGKITLQSEASYPASERAGPCHAHPGTPGLHITAYTCRSWVGSEESILRWLAHQGPVAVAVNALSWQHYLGGVLQHHCPGALTDLNHAVTLVGYDLEHPVPHYIARNSWGKHFGSAGDLRLAVGGNTCGLALEVAMMQVKLDP